MSNFRTKFLGPSFLIPPFLGHPVYNIVYLATSQRATTNPKEPKIEKMASSLIVSDYIQPCSENV